MGNSHYNDYFVICISELLQFCIAFLKLLYRTIDVATITSTSIGVEDGHGGETQSDGQILCQN